MTWEEEIADRFGITEPHDENCQGDYLCREHFIERLVEARKKADTVHVIGQRVPGGKFSGSVDVQLGETLLFTRRRPLRVAPERLVEDAVVDWIKATPAEDFRRADEMKVRLERMGVPDPQKWINDQRGL